MLITKCGHVTRLGHGLMRGGTGVFGSRLADDLAVLLFGFRGCLRGVSFCNSISVGGGRRSGRFRGALLAVVLNNRRAA